MESLDKDIFISKMEIKGEPVYVKVIWKNNDNHLFDIQLLYNDSSWSGKYSLETAKRYGVIVDENELLYQYNVKKCLQNKNSEYLLDFESVPSNTNTAHFCWKKKFEGSTAVLVHGKVPLDRDEITISKNTFIDILLDKNYELSLEIEKSKEKNHKLSLELEKCKKELETFAEMKISLESTLYGKFLQLLNEKKRRIQLLEELLEETEKC